MRVLRAGAVLVILMMFFSGCLSGPVRTVSGANTPTPSVTAASQSALISSSTPVSAPPGEPQSTESPASVTPETSNPGPFNEDNVTKYFRFGMSVEALVKELDASKIAITDKSNDGNYGQPMFSWTIRTDDFTFNFDRKGRLYDIDMLETDTAKGLEVGDTVERMRELYGTEDETHPDKYIYYRNGYLLSFNTDSYEEKINTWSLFVDIWNNPDAFFSNSSSVTRLTGDDVIQFNEDNFTQYFRLGMNRQALEKKLRDLKVRINREEEGENDAEEPNGVWDVWIDHVIFSFDSDNRLYWLNVDGWDTAKGLKKFDSIDTLHALYGKEDEYDGSWSEYIYNRNGYKFSVETGYADPGGTVIFDWNVFLDHSH